MPSSPSLKLLVQDLIDGRLSADEAARVEQLIRDDPELADTARFYRWLNDQLPKLFETDGESLPPQLQGLLDALAALEDGDEPGEPSALPGAAALAGKPR